MQDSSIKPVSRLYFGVIIGVYGVHGEVLIKTFTKNPLDIGSYGHLENEDGSQFFELTHIVSHRRGVRSRIKGLCHRDQAEQMKGMKLYVNRRALPVLPDGDFYHADLIGLTAITPMGEKIGVVRAVHNFGGGDLLEISNEFILFCKDNVPHIDLSNQSLTVILPRFDDEDIGQ